MLPIGLGTFGFLVTTIQAKFGLGPVKAEQLEKVPVSDNIAPADSNCPPPAIGETGMASAVGGHSQDIILGNL
jgi:hypothetical protein